MSLYHVTSRGSNLKKLFRSRDGMASSAPSLGDQKVLKAGSMDPLRGIIVGSRGKTNCGSATRPERSSS
jgi:hypothetical protein